MSGYLHEFVETGSSSKSVISIEIINIVCMNYICYKLILTKNNVIYHSVSTLTA